MIRKMTIWDVPEIASMWKALMEETWGTLMEENTDGEEFNKEQFALELTVNLYRLDYVLLVAMKGDLIVGFIIGSKSKNGMGVCAQIYVKKGFRNFDIDDELMNKGVEKMKEQGVKKMTFTTTPRLAKFWEKKGYKTSRVIVEMEKEI